MKRLFSFLIIAVAFVINLKAESTVYVFIKQQANMMTELLINGKRVCDMRGPVKKIIKADNWNKMKNDFYLYDECYRKLVLNQEGRIVISFDATHTNSLNLKETRFKGEIPLDVEDGQTYYVVITGKGMNDWQIKEPKEKDVKKWIDKWKTLPTVTVSE